MPKKLYFKVFNRLNYLSRIQMNIKILFLLLFLMYLTSLISKGKIIVTQSGISDSFTIIKKQLILYFKLYALIYFI